MTLRRLDGVGALIVIALLVFLAGCAGSRQLEPGADPVGTASPVTVLTFTGTGAEWEDAMLACMRSDGWDVTPDPLGYGFGNSTIAGVERENYARASDACRASVGELPMPTPPTDDELTVLYSRAVEVRDCLVALGYVMPNPPTEQGYADAYRSNDPWTPHAFLPGGLDEPDWLDANRRCPALASDPFDP